MNIFVVDSDPVIAARSLCDKHIVVMQKEAGQMLSSAMILTGNDLPGLYELTHQNHPCSIWARQSKSNFAWLKTHGIAICEEYTRRYHKRHKSQDIIEMASDESIPDGELSPFVKCMPDEYKVEDPVESYRRFYIGAKAYFAKWKYSEVPSWFKV